MTPAWFTPRRRKAESRRPDVPAAAPVAVEASVVPECQREARRLSAPIGVEVWLVATPSDPAVDFDTEREALAWAAHLGREAVVWPVRVEAS